MGAAAVIAAPRRVSASLPGHSSLCQDHLSLEKLAWSPLRPDKELSELRGPPEACRVAEEVHIERQGWPLVRQGLWRQLGRGTQLGAGRPQQVIGAYRNGFLFSRRSISLKTSSKDFLDFPLLTTRRVESCHFHAHGAPRNMRVWHMAANLTCVRLVSHTAPNVTCMCGRQDEL